jgi:type II secretory pathway pseudopilin PulG
MVRIILHVAECWAVACTLVSSLVCRVLANDKQHRERRPERGSMLLELLMALVVLSILFAMSAPHLVQLNFDTQAARARQYMRDIAQLRMEIALCDAMPNNACTPSVALANLNPAPDSILVTGGYRFTDTGGITLTAMPTNSASGQMVFTLGTSGVVFCGGAPCTN